MRKRVLQALPIILDLNCACIARGGYLPYDDIHVPAFSGAFSGILVYRGGGVITEQKIINWGEF